MLSTGATRSSPQAVALTYPPCMALTGPVRLQAVCSARHCWLRRATAQAPTTSYCALGAGLGRRMSADLQALCVGLGIVGHADTPLPCSCALPRSYASEDMPDLVERGILTNLVGPKQGQQHLPVQAHAPAMGPAVDHVTAVSHKHRCLPLQEDFVTAGKVWVDPTLPYINTLR